ncbi:PREDICTED: NAC domain-containing protein 21/22-like [Populus euphratica]|uniref:NAC domain-containing protein 21/22-like n=1 Tax=Populus euphratica TaxID=75702 RepID=A0AAJ6Y6X3_POPEU|nr:PREDICTED: NAC domain-containing protein 21/22-like [Populus euphratica]
MASGAQASNVPTGYRFSPNDDDLIVHYLKKKSLDDFKGGVANEWFFFSTRSEDADIILTENGYYAVDPEGTAPIAWKDKIVGYVKTLNFYQGSPPNGSETDWMVEEFSVNAEFVPINKDDHSTQEKPTLLYAKFLEYKQNMNGISSSTGTWSFPVTTFQHDFLSFIATHPFLFLSSIGIESFSTPEHVCGGGTRAFGQSNLASESAFILKLYFIDRRTC